MSLLRLPPDLHICWRCVRSAFFMSGSRFPLPDNQHTNRLYPNSSRSKITIILIMIFFLALIYFLLSNIPSFHNQKISNYFPVLWFVLILPEALDTVCNSYIYKQQPPGKNIYAGQFYYHIIYPESKYRYFVLCVFKSIQ